MLTNVNILILAAVERAEEFQMKRKGQNYFQQCQFRSEKLGGGEDISREEEGESLLETVLEIGLSGTDLSRSCVCLFNVISLA